jgi:hypothetical protein
LSFGGAQPAPQPTNPHRAPPNNHRRFLVVELNRRAAADEGLEFADPNAVRAQGRAGVVSESDGAFEVAIFALPGGLVARAGACGGG